MPILIIILGVLLLVFMIVKLKLNTFVSLIIVSITVGMMLGISWTKIADVVEKGIGDQVGHLAVIFGLGSMLGKLISDSGAGQRIATTLTEKFGKRYIEWAIVIASFIIGLALFFEVGLVVLLPIIYVVAQEMDMALLYLAIPMAAALNVAHAFLPPHPAPTAIAGIMGAPLGQVLLLGIIAAIPTVIIMGPGYNHLLYHFAPQIYHKNVKIPALGKLKTFKNSELPNFEVSVLTAIMPVLLITVATLAKYFLPSKWPISAFLQFIGIPDIAMILALIFAVYSVGLSRGMKMKQIGQCFETAIKQIAMMLLIIGGGGAFKEVLVQGGVANYISHLFTNLNLSPIIAAWLITAVLRICLGSTTVAALTGAGLTAPMIATSGIDPALMVLAVGAGSVFCDHVNGAGFWMVKQYFGLSLKEALLSWTTLTMAMSVVGLLAVLGISLFV
ncbi:gluconate:proton symporter [Secundilactobacillus pentosiphilus]|uniref:Gluconate:proton symporter n=1 Tax=Secundilactobacillus pentosiphilus TaxID=1714682 RepID=A0A1Z5ILB9_9LACO|nr:gluconate:H+ symporter [Secundilactobacillus pentosiphilus]GAX02499.1 gluconate:proton symporter [Secundilactobacillus pentosiphilus]